jgi:hypothetical protein
MAGSIKKSPPRGFDARQFDQLPARHGPSSTPMGWIQRNDFISLTGHGTIASVNDKYKFGHKTVIDDHMGASSAEAVGQLEKLFASTYRL